MHFLHDYWHLIISFLGGLSLFITIVISLLWFKLNSDTAFQFHKKHCAYFVIIVFFSLNEKLKLNEMWVVF